MWARQTKVGATTARTNRNAGTLAKATAIPATRIGRRGSQYDAIEALTLSLGGALKVNLIDLMGGSNLFAPSLGNFFDLLVADTISGMFASFDFTDAPTPAALLLFGPGIALMFVLRRRKRV